MVHTIDLAFQSQPQAISAFLVEGSKGLVLVETGPGSCLSALREGIATLGFEEKNVTDVLVTHIHLDHAGAAGWWAQQGAKIYVHPRGGRHLIDPSRLIESARMVYGDQMDRLWGEMLPAPESQVQVVSDRETFETVAGLSFTAFDTPGHAKHHHVFQLAETGAMFTGDVAGVRFDESDYVSPATAPPQFDLSAYEASIKLLEEMALTEIYLTHGGAISGKENVAEHFQMTLAAVRLAEEFARLRLSEGMDEDSLQVAYQAFQMELAFRAEVPSELWRVYETANPCGMCADGLRIGIEAAAK